MSKRGKPPCPSGGAVESETKPYDPCEREPRTFGELVAWMAYWAVFSNPSRSGVPVPTSAYNPDHLYLQAYCRALFGEWSLETLGNLRDRYGVQTGKVMDQNDATTLREIADHFRRQNVVPVTAGPPPVSRLWDSRPLEDESWGNILGFNDGTGDGHTIEMRLWIKATPETPLMNTPPMYRPARVALPPFFADGGTRRCCIPSTAEVEIVRKHFPNIADPTNPNWFGVAAKLQGKGHQRADLDKLSPPELLALLDSTELPTTTDPNNGKCAKPRAGEKSIGRPKLGEGPKATSTKKARRNAYDLIRAARKDGWGPQALVAHFRDNKDFADVLKAAGVQLDRRSKEKFFRAALAWIKDNPNQETQ